MSKGSKKISCAVKALSPALVLAISSAAAQEASTPNGAANGANLEEVVVTGYRASLESALAEKREQSGVVDVIKAEDIADFPDSNLAESIQRVPGVSISRVAGEGKAITVRGLNPSFTRVRINGMEAQSAASGTVSDRGANLGRGFDFNVFASELFNTIAVRKTTSAEIVEGSLGATVDLTTARPFDFPGLTFVTSVQGNYNDLSEDVEPRFSALISNTWADGKFGALASIAYTERHYFEEEFGSGGWNPATVDGGFCTPVGRTPQNPANDPVRGTDAANCATGVERPAANDPYYDLVNRSTVFLPRLPRYGRFEHDQERLGVSASLQWQPADSTLFTLDALYSDYDVKREESWLEGFSFARAISQNGKPQTAIRFAELIPVGVSNTQGTNFGLDVFDIGLGTFEGVDVRADTQHDEWKSEFMQFTLTGSHEFSDTLRLNIVAGQSTNNLDQPVQTTIMFQRPNAGMTIDFTQDRDRPTFTHDFDVTDPAQYTFGAGNAEVRMTPLWVENEYRTGDASLAWTWADDMTLKFGARFTEFDYDIHAKARPNNFLVPDLTTAQLTDVTRLVTGFGDGGLSGRFPSSWLTTDYDKFIDQYDIYSGTGLWVLGGSELPGPRGNIRHLTEKDTSVYLQQDFRFDVFGIPLRGDIGVRYVLTDLESTGYQVATTPVQVTVDHDYGEFLPALNLAAELSDELIGRFSVARVMSRPEIGFLTPGGAVNLTGTPGVSSGNPFLEPILATTYDVSVEWYFAESSLLALGLFYKDIETYIQNQSQQMSFRETGLPLALLIGTNLDPDNTPFTVSRPVNTPGGPLKGFEINYQQAFSFLPGWMSNFGALLNYTWVDSEIEYYLAQSATTTTRDDLLGLSKNAYNATVYWENTTVSARLSASYRDKFLEALPANNPLQDVEGTDEMLTFDASASWSLNDQFKLTFEALNLFDEYKRQYIDSDRDSTFVYGHTGRQFSLGVQYRFQ
ncbi:TonB-dependent receptor [Povalibacter uvarum]|uniref:TonB-dependent receptor n=1 Tax=Povalibacter uvarum TaxID=732238 RepID=A0A841HQH7_9GAMM|nr:TonB-dependent receptor [Povalibacter uvarum]MBB6095467.1 TonB-dependent receptor [Povalibacter uvarum]